jgi:glycosyltransferase involved in cell wall biosynthesis
MDLPRTGSIERKLLCFKPTVIHVATPFGTGVAGRHLAIKHGILMVASHHTHFVRYLPFYNLQWMGKLLWRYLHWFHRPCRRKYLTSKSVLEECLADGWEGLEIWSRGIDSRIGADVEFVVAGDGPAANEIKALTERTGVRSRFLGAVPQTSLQKWMANFFALKSSMEEAVGNFNRNFLKLVIVMLLSIGHRSPDRKRLEIDEIIA